MKVATFQHLWPQDTWVLKMLVPVAFPDTVEAPPADLLAGRRLLDVPALELPGGGRMPASGLGLCCRLSAVGSDVTRSVLWFLLLGGRLLDTAEGYGNHREVGEGLRLAVASGLVRREEVFVTTKLPPARFGAEAVEKWVPEMLNALGLDYVDLVLLHSPGDTDDGLHFGMLKMPAECVQGGRRRCRAETWEALAEFRRRGAVRNLGVSNFGPRQMGELMALGSAPVAVNQLEYHPWVEEPHRQAVAFCHRHGIAVTAYCSMGGPETASSTLAHVELMRLAAKHNKTTGQILLRWAFQRNVSVIPGTGRPAHMRENLDVFDFQLAAQDMAAIDAQPPLVAHRSKYVRVPDEVS